MPMVQVKDMDSSLYNWLRYFAKEHHRSISQAVVSILQEKAAQSQVQARNPVDDFLSYSGTWADERSAQEIADEIVGARNRSERFEADNELFG